jgi:hypothetical protein
MFAHKYRLSLVAALFCSLLFLFLLSSCDLPTVGGTGEVFPQADGNTWTYHNDVEDNQWSFVMGSPQEHDGGFTVYPVRFYIGSQQTGTKYLAKRDDGLYWYDTLSSELNYWKLLEFPIVVGNSWEFTQDGAVVVGTLEAVEDIEGGGNTYKSCLRVHYSGASNETIWFCPGLGIARDRAHTALGGYTLKLESFSLK